jgi:hypothetical protein
MTTIETSPTRLQTALNAVFKLSTREVAAELAERLGLKLTALIGGVTETRRVTEWAEGSREPRREEALRAALQATRAIAERYDDAAARAWFMSTNAGFGMRAPVVVMREAREPADFDRLVTIAVQDVS